LSHPRFIRVHPRLKENLRQALSMMESFMRVNGENQADQLVEGSIRDQEGSSALPSRCIGIWLRIFSGLDNGRPNELS
jgi:hypothetical protein